MTDIFEAPDRSVRGDLSPVWRMLSLSGTSEGVRIVDPVVCALPRPRGDWREDLGLAAQEASEQGSTLIVPVERPWARAVLYLLAGRGWSLRRPPSRSEIEDHLARLGGSIEATYTLWPSARTPRIAFPQGSRKLVVWAQRSGVLGGGGNRLWARVAARSPLFTPFAMFMSPAYALVVRMREPSGA